MGIRIFQKGKWSDLKQGYLRLSDCMDLDPVLDRLLIRRIAGLLLQRIADGSQERWMPVVLYKYGYIKAPEDSEQSGNSEAPGQPEPSRDHELRGNTEAPEDVDDRLILREQAMREDETKVLKEAVYRYGGYDVGRFAFCRLTGYNPPVLDGNESTREAYPYECGLKSDMIREDIEEFCREMIGKEGPFAEEARQWLAKLPEITDDTLDRWAEGKTERRVHEDTYKGLQERMSMFFGAPEPDEEALEDLMRTLFDAYIIMIYEERGGHIPRSTKYRITDPFLRYALMVMSTQVGRDYLYDGIQAVSISLYIGRVKRDNITLERIGEVIWTESGSNPRHSFFLGMAYQYGIETGIDEDKALKMYAHAVEGGFTQRI